ncbi:hypothetical protein KC330_g28 [Hortaea werneckii]|nr:hypothetical protein KC330_g28 [Hortaea werneckii]
MYKQDHLRNILQHLPLPEIPLTLSPLVWVLNGLSASSSSLPPNRQSRRILCLPSHAVLPERVQLDCDNARGINPPTENSPLCFAEFASPIELLCAMPLMCVKSPRTIVLVQHINMHEAGTTLSMLWNPRRRSVDRSTWSGTLIFRAKLGWLRRRNSSGQIIAVRARGDEAVAIGGLGDLDLRPGVWGSQILSSDTIALLLLFAGPTALLPCDATSRQAVIANVDTAGSSLLGVGVVIDGEMMSGCVECDELLYEGAQAAQGNGFDDDVCEAFWWHWV